VTLMLLGQLDRDALDSQVRARFGAGQDLPDTAIRVPASDGEIPSSPCKKATSYCAPRSEDPAGWHRTGGSSEGD